MNYLEELAYWYFRLNGYFLIQNYVNHRHNGLRYTYESDFLGIRLPNTFESIGGNNENFDQDITSSEKIMCVIGEAKNKRLLSLYILMYNKYTIVQRIMPEDKLPLDKTVVFGEKNG